MARATAPSHKCDNPLCTNFTTNPKFCSQSCSATIANSSKPKRKPENACASCGRPLITKKRVCDECKEILAAAERRALGNIKSYLTLNDEIIEKPIEKVSSSKRTVFKMYLHRANINETSTCGDLIDAVIGLCFSEPIFLRKEDCRRYAALLHDFVECNLKIYLYPKCYESPVRLMPIKFLHNAMEEWVFSCFEGEKSALLPHYALDATELIRKVAWGSYQHEPEPWELESICLKKDGSREFFQQVDKGFKKRFTEYMQLEVIARVPDGMSVEDQGTTVLSGGSEFEFKVRRCHLSDNFYECSFLDVSKDPEAPFFDLMSEFKLKGHIIGQRRNQYGTRAEYPFNLPPNWITHELRYDPSGRDIEGTWIQAPKWHASVAST